MEKYQGRDITIRVSCSGGESGNEDNDWVILKTAEVSLDVVVASAS